MQRNSGTASATFCYEDVTQQRYIVFTRILSRIDRRNDLFSLVELQTNGWIGAGITWNLNDVGNNFATVQMIYYRSRVDQFESPWIFMVAVGWILIDEYIISTRRACPCCWCCLKLLQDCTQGSTNYVSIYIYIYCSLLLPAVSA